MIKLRVWATLVFVFSGLAVASPAQSLFDEATRLLVEQYGGFAKVGPSELRQKFQSNLDLACSPDPNCPADKAATVLRALMAELGDPHSRFFSPSEYADLQRRLRGSTSDRPQMGVQLQVVDGLDGLLVIEVNFGSPAEEAGLKRGDRILSLNGQPLPSNADERVPFLREWVGKGQSLQVGILRVEDSLELTLLPRLISLQQIPSLQIRPDGVGVLRIPSFTGYLQVGPEIHKLVKQAQEQGAKAMIVDLRNNSGGLLSECLVGAGAFVEETFRRLHQPGGNNDQGYHNGVFYTRQGGEEFGLFRVSQARWTQPVVVLVNERTASCAEYFAFDLQEGRQAPVIGTQTAGVGNTATVILQLSNGSGMQITTSQAERRDGSPYPDSVTPNLSISNDWQALSLGRDVILERALELLNDTALQQR